MDFLLVQAVKPWYNYRLCPIIPFWKGYFTQSSKEVMKVVPLCVLVRKDEGAPIHLKMGPVNSVANISL